MEENMNTSEIFLNIDNLPEILNKYKLLAYHV